MPKGRRAKAKAKGKRAKGKRAKGAKAAKPGPARARPTASSPLPTKKRKVGQKVEDFIMTVFGPPGVGKTTFVDGFADRVFFISTDRGTRHFEALGEEVETFDEILMTLDKLERPGACDNYDMIAIDHAVDFAAMAARHVCEELEVENLGDAAWSKGWNGYTKAMMDVIARVKALRLGLVFITHEVTKKIETALGTVDKTMPDMDKRTWKAVIPLCDIVAYCGFRTVKKGGQLVELRTVETTPRESLFAKDRTGRMTHKRGWDLLDGQKFARSFREE
jgi:hypothetical protein